MFYMGRVTAIHPDSHTIDVVMMDSNKPLGGVTVLSGSASGNTGWTELNIPTPRDPDDPASTTNLGMRDTYAVIGYASRDMPFVIGFIYPQVTQMHFEEEDLSIHRHGSDVYSTKNQYGDIELAHPSGTYVRLAQDLEHVDLTGADYDGLWAIAQNTETAPGARLIIANTGGVDMTGDTTASLTEPGDAPGAHGDIFTRFDCNAVGDVEIENVGHTEVTTTKYVTITSLEEDVTVQALVGDVIVEAVEQDVIVRAGGHIAETADEYIDLTAGTDIHLVAGGEITFSSGGQVSIDAGGAATITATSVTITAPVIELKSAAVTVTSAAVVVTGIVTAKDFVTA